MLSLPDLSFLCPAVTHHEASLFLVLGFGDGRGQRLRFEVVNQSVLKFTTFHQLTQGMSSNVALKPKVTVARQTYGQNFIRKVQYPTTSSFVPVFSVQSTVVR